MKPEAVIHHQNNSEVTLGSEEPTSATQSSSKNRDKGKEKVDDQSSPESTNNIAVTTFTNPDHDERQFKTWYCPETVKYLLHSSPNNAKCLRVVFDDHQAEQKGFKDQLQQLIVLSNKLNRPALFISKEPGCPNHWMCGMTMGNQVVIVNPIGLTKHHDFYATLQALVAEQTIEKVFLSDLQLQHDPEGYVSCGPICVELLMHWSSLEDIKTRLFDQIKKGKEASIQKLECTNVDIASQLPSMLQTFNGLNPEAYQARLTQLRANHLAHLKTHSALQQPQTQQIINEYWERCLNSLEQIVFRQLLFREIRIVKLGDDSHYVSLKNKLNEMHRITPRTGITSRHKDKEKIEDCSTQSRSDRMSIARREEPVPQFSDSIHERSEKIRRKTSSIMLDKLAHLEFHSNWMDANEQENFKKRFKRNLQSCQEHINNSPKPEAAIYNFLGYQYCSQEEFHEARGYFERSLEITDNKDPVALANLVHLYRKQYEQKKAQQYQDDYFRVLNTEISQGYLFWSKAYHYTRLYQYEKALDAYNQAIQRLPKLVELRVYKGILLNREGRSNLAIRCLLQAQKMCDDEYFLYIIYTHLGRAFANKKNNRKANFSRAMMYFEKALSVEPEGENVLKQIGKLYVKNKKFKEAIQFFEKAIKQRPTFFAYHNLGLIYRRMQVPKLSNAILNFRKALALPRGDIPEIRLDLIEALIEMKAYGEALSECVRLSKLTPDVPRLIFYWAKCLAARGEFEGAEKQYRRLLLCDDPIQVDKAQSWLKDYYQDSWKDSHSLDVLITLISFLYDQEKYSSAISFLEDEKILQEMDDYHLYYYTCLLYLKMGAIKKAIDYLLKCIKKSHCFEQEYGCYELYLAHFSNSHNAKYTKKFMAYYAQCEAAFHKKNDRIIWHKNMNVLFRSKQEHKIVRLSAVSNAKLKKDVQRIRIQKQNKKSINANLAAATLNFIVTDRPHYDPAHGRICIQVPLEGRLKSTQNLAHVTDVYEFKVSKKRYKRSPVLLEDVLESKPLIVHPTIRALYKNADKSEFHRRFHCSERALFGYLLQNVVEIVDALESACESKKQLKVYAFVIDIYSERYLCSDCQESVFFWYNPKGRLIKKLCDELQKRGHKVRSESQTLSTVVRVIAEKPGYKQKKQLPNQHKSKPIDIKEHCSMYTSLLLQQDINAAENETGSSTVFTSTKI